MPILMRTVGLENVALSKVVDEAGGVLINVVIIA